MRNPIRCLNFFPIPLKFCVNCAIIHGEKRIFSGKSLLWAPPGWSNRWATVAPDNAPPVWVLSLFSFLCPLQEIDRIPVTPCAAAVTSSMRTCSTGVHLIIDGRIKAQDRLAEVKIIHTAGPVLGRPHPEIRYAFACSSSSSEIIPDRQSSSWRRISVLVTS